MNLELCHEKTLGLGRDFLMTFLPVQEFCFVFNHFFSHCTGALFLPVQKFCFVFNHFFPVQELCFVFNDSPCAGALPWEDSRSGSTSLKNWSRLKLFQFSQIQSKLKLNQLKWKLKIQLKLKLKEKQLNEFKISLLLTQSFSRWQMIFCPAQCKISETVWYSLTYFNFKKEKEKLVYFFCVLWWKWKSIFWIY